MRRARLKIRGGSAVYHCFTRTVNKEMLMDSGAKEVLRKQLWQISDFSGVEVITYCLMGNHFHILIRVPDRESVKVSDRELIRRYRVLYPRRTEHAPAEPKMLEERLRRGGKEGEAIRRQLLARMHDVSEFMKSLKQRYTLWYNRTRGRVGTLWSERYKSVLIEGRDAAMRVTAAYIDLNPVRAGMVEDPKDYRWCGYGEAMGGHEHARNGIVEAIGPMFEKERSWRSAARDYRKLLYCKGSESELGKGGSADLPIEEWRKVMEEGGKVPVAVALRCRVRYFTDGAVLGSRDYVEGIFLEYREQFATKRRSGARVMKGSAWEGLTVVRDLRKQVFTRGSCRA